MSGSAIVRSRRQSIVVGDIDKFLKNFDATVRKTWEYYSLQIELLGYYYHYLSLFIHLFIHSFIL